MTIPRKPLTTERIQTLILHEVIPKVQSLSNQMKRISEAFPVKCVSLVTTVVVELRFVETEPRSVM